MFVTSIFCLKILIAAFAPAKKTMVLVKTKNMVELVIYGQPYFIKSFSFLICKTNIFSLKIMLPMWLFVLRMIKSASLYLIG